MVRMITERIVVMTNKNKIIIRLSLCAAFAVLLAGLVTARQAVKKYASLAGNDYQRSLYGLAESAGNRRKAPKKSRKATARAGRTISSLPSAE